MADNVGGKIISELGQIVKDVGKQTAQIPKDIAGKALESLGASSGSKKVSPQMMAQMSGEAGGEPSAFQQISESGDMQLKRRIARKALEEIAGGQVKKPREPSIWERLQQEQEQKKQMLSQQKAQSARASIPMPSGKRKRGDLYGTQAKKTSTENRNVRQD